MDDRRNRGVSRKRGCGFAKGDDALELVRTPFHRHSAIESLSCFVRFTFNFILAFSESLPIGGVFSFLLLFLARRAEMTHVLKDLLQMNYKIFFFE